MKGPIDTFYHKHLKHKNRVRLNKIEQWKFLGGTAQM